MGSNYYYYYNYNYGYQWPTTEDPWAHYYEGNNGNFFIIPSYAGGDFAASAPPFYDAVHSWISTFDLYALYVNATTGSIIFLLNLYILLVIVFNKEFQSINFYPVALQAFCDMLIGQSTARFNTLEILARSCDRTTEVIKCYHEGPLAQLLRGTRFVQPINDYMKKSYNFFRQDLNLFSTGYCILVMALERYILVCHPFRAASLLRRRNRGNVCAILTLFIISYSVMDETCNNGSSNSFEKYCGTTNGHESKSGRYRVIGDAIILFFIPAAITSTLYIFVGIKLAKSKTKRVRNRDLTIAFLLSCLLWIFFWLPNEVMKVLDSFSAVARVNEFTMARAIQKLFAKFSGALFEFSPLINPLVFLFVTRGFQQPIKNLFGALKKMVLRKT